MERFGGSIQRECLDHVIILNENHLIRVVKDYLLYYHGHRTHLGLGGDCPEHREAEPPSMGQGIELPMVGGLHHRYTQQASQFMLLSIEWRVKDKPPPAPHDIRNF